MSELSVTHLTKKMEDKILVEDISFTVEEGNVFAIVGPSGAGKTTILRLICGLDQPTSGSIHYQDKEITHLKPNERGFTFVFQDGALFPHLTVEKNIGYGLKPYGYTKEKIQENIQTYTKLLKINHLLDRYPSSLSAGEKQRVGIARAFVREPKLILLDEPFSNLDPLLKEELKKDLMAIQKKQNQTMILVTHDQNEALELANEILVIKDGKYVECNIPSELYRNPRNLFTAQFIGIPQMNLLSLSTIDAHSFSIFSHKRQIEKELPMEIVVGIRCEDIQLDEQGEFEGKIIDIRQFMDRYLIDLQIGEDILSFYSNTIEELNSIVHFSIDFDKIHLFDRESGKLIEI